MFKIKRANSIGGEITVPGDKSISHRSIILSALSNGRCEIRNFLDGEDCLRTAAIFEQLGVRIERPEPRTVIVHGVAGKFTAPREDLYCGNSGTTMRLLSGLLSGQPFVSRLTGDPSLSKRPMKRVIGPLTQMGAKLRGEGEGDRPPLVIDGGDLRPIDYSMPMASAQVKSAILLAGLFAKGRTSVTEPAPSRDHTERMMDYYLIQTTRSGNTVSIHGGQIPESRDFDVPGDISSAAFWMVAAAAHPDSHLLIRNVGLNPTRSAIIGILVRMGATIREMVENLEQGEPKGTIDIKGGTLQGTVIEGEEIANAIDEIPILAVAGALAEGTTEIRDAKELRVKETDRIAAVCGNLRAMGADVEEKEDGMIIHGGKPLRGATLPSFGDHRIAMGFAIAGLFASGETVIEETECVQTSYPRFAETLEKLSK